MIDTGVDKYLLRLSESKWKRGLFSSENCRYLAVFITCQPARSGFDLYSFEHRRHICCNRLGLSQHRQHSLPRHSSEAYVFNRVSARFDVQRGGIIAYCLLSDIILVVYLGLGEKPSNDIAPIFVGVLTSMGFLLVSPSSCGRSIFDFNSTGAKAVEDASFLHMSFLFQSRAVEV